MKRIWTIFFLTGMMLGEVYPQEDTLRPPCFPGGEQKFKEFLNEHMCYPREVLKRNIQGRVDIWFIVDTLGRIQQAKVRETVSHELGEIFLQAVKEMPLWIPATKGRKKIPQPYILTTYFMIGDTADEIKSKPQPCN